MRKTAWLATAALSLAACWALASTPPTTVGAAAADVIDLGKEIAFDRKKGNCLACHLMDDGASPGDIGPPLVAMKARFPDRATLRAQIWDAQVANPATRMPPFGKHQALSEKEIDAVVDYLYTL
jgi:sulfur-oxidizing protein SoxX